MPGSCLLAPHLATMLTRRHKFPGIDLRILIRSNEEIVKEILGGHLDFGFVTTMFDVPGLRLVPFCNEEFVFVSPMGSKVDICNIDYLLKENFVTYPGMENYFDAWQHHHFPKSKKRLFDSLNIKGHIESIHGAITLIVNGVGCSVIPRHCVADEVFKDRISVLIPNTKKNSVMNTIYIATLAGQRPTRRAQQVMDWFYDMHPEISRK